MSTFADRLRAARKGAGMSRATLGELAKLSVSYVSLLESGARGMPSSAVLARIAGAVGLSVRDLDPAVVVDPGVEVVLARARECIAMGDPLQARVALSGVVLVGCDPSTVRRVLRVLADAHELCGDLDASACVLRELVALARTGRAWCEVADAAMSLVATHLELGDLNTAISTGVELAAEVAAAGIVGSDEHLRLESTIVWAYFERGDLLYATHLAKGLIEVAEAVGSVRARGSLYWNAGIVANGRGDDVRAVEWTRCALTCMEEAGSERDVARLQLQFGGLLLRLEDPDPASALEYLRPAALMLSEAGSGLERTRAVIEIARAHVMLGNVSLAEAFVREAVLQLGSTVNIDACSARVVLGDVLMLRGDVDAAVETYQWAADRLSMMGADRWAAEVWRGLGDRFRARGDVAGAALAFRSGLLSATRTSLVASAA